MTTTAAARELHCSRRTVQKHALAQGWTPEGRDIIIDAERLARLRELVQTRVGRPRKRAP